MKNSYVNKFLIWNRSDYINWSAVRDSETTYHVTRNDDGDLSRPYMPYMLYVNRSDFFDRNITNLSGKGCKTVEEAKNICTAHCNNHFKFISKDSFQYHHANKGAETELQM